MTLLLDTHTLLWFLTNDPRQQLPVAPKPEGFQRE